MCKNTDWSGVSSDEGNLLRDGTTFSLSTRLKGMGAGAFKKVSGTLGSTELIDVLFVDELELGGIL